MAIVELGSMTRAAERLNVAQPALGLQMRQLEQELGVELLQRHSRGVLPTSAGQLLSERCGEILDLVERTRREVGAFGTDAMETVRLGLTPSLTQLVGSELLVRARRDLPRVQLHVVEEMSFVLLDALRRRDLDLALAYDVPESAGFERLAWLQEDLLFLTRVAGVAAPGADAFGTISLREALRSELALAGSRDPIRQMVTRAAEGLGLTPNVTFEVQSIPAMKILATDGVAASIMPYGSAIAELAAGRLTGRRVVEPRLTRTLYVVTRPNFAELRGAAAILTLLDGVRERLNLVMGTLARHLPA